MIDLIIICAKLGLRQVKIQARLFTRIKYKDSKINVLGEVRYGFYTKKSHSRVA